MTHNPHTSSAFDEFLREKGLYEECSEIAIKRVLARQLAEEMKQKAIFVDSLFRDKSVKSILQSR
jgi:antitoxin HicB